MATITIRAADSSSGLDEVLRLLGPDAMIVATRQVGGMVEITAAPPGAPAVPAARPADFAAHLARHTSAAAPLADPPVSDVLPGLPRRLVLAGPPGAGVSMLAARLAAHALRRRDGPRPRLIAPRPDALLLPGALDGWARLMGLRAEHPVWQDGGLPTLSAPGAEECQIIDLSCVPAAKPQEAAALRLPVEAAVWLVMPTGLHPAMHVALLAQWGRHVDALALTRLDLCPPTAEDLALSVRHGLPIAMTAQGRGLVDALAPDPTGAACAPTTPTRRKETAPHAAACLS